MITKEVIKNIYKKYPRRAKSVDDLDMAMLFDSVGILHDISVEIDSARLVIGSMSNNSIFHSILLKHIHAFVPFEEWIAIVLPTSIIFLNRIDHKVSIHIKPHKEPFWERIKRLFSKEQ